MFLKFFTSGVVGCLPCYSFCLPSLVTIPSFIWRDNIPCKDYIYQPPCRLVQACDVSDSWPLRYKQKFCVRLLRLLLKDGSYSLYLSNTCCVEHGCNGWCSSSHIGCEVKAAHWRWHSGKVSGDIAETPDCLPLGFFYKRNTLLFCERHLICVVFCGM
jgi:hypothetical protein